MVIMKTQTQTQKELIAVFDLYDYYDSETKYFIEHKDQFLELIGEENKDVNDIEDYDVEDYFYKNHWHADWHKEDFEEDIKSEFKNHLGKDVFIDGRNVGWQNLSGEISFTLNDPMDIFYEIAPQTDLTFYLWKINNNEYEVKISHHDSPTGEFYNITIKD